MIRFIKYNEIDLTRWDRCIIESLQGLPYAHSTYLSALEVKWDGLIMGDYDAVAALPWHRNRIIKSLYTPYSVQQLGWLSAEPLPADAEKTLITYIHTHYFRYHYALNYSFGGQPFTDILPAGNLVLDLEKEFPDLEKKFSPHHRREIHKAAKQSFLLHKNTTVKEFLPFLQQCWGARFYPLSFIKGGASCLMETMVKEGKGKIWTVCDERGNICAGLFFIVWQRRLIFLFASSHADGKKRGAMYFLTEHLIRAYAGQKILLDFEGSSIAGIRFFYLGFGARSQNFYILKGSKFSFNW